MGGESSLKSRGPQRMSGATGALGKAGGTGRSPRGGHAQNEQRWPRKGGEECRHGNRGCTWPREGWAEGTVTPSPDWAGGVRALSGEEGRWKKVQL